MTDPLRPTLPQVELKDAAIYPPPAGKRVLALNTGGVLGFTVVNKDFESQFDAWCEYPTVPDSVKRRQAARYARPKPQDSGASGGA